MITSKNRKATFMILTFAVLLAFFLAPLPLVKAADHAESTSVAIDPGADLGDTFVFLNPTDNTKVVLSMTVHGFIPPGQALNQAFFSPDIRYRFEIENTGDAAPDRFVDVTFSPQTGRNVPQTATIRLPGGKGNGQHASFITAPTTVPTFGAMAPPFVVTTDANTGIKFFAGLTDDPFYFDIPAFGRFVASVNAGAPNASLLSRGRDAFAGYNIHTIAIELPASMLRGSNGNIIGVNAVTSRRRNTNRPNTGGIETHGDFVQVDRGGVPAVNTALIPFPRKNEFNAATPVDDANLLFADSIISTLTLFGTNSTNIGILAQVAVLNGDYLRLDMGIPNTSLGSGQRLSTPGYTGFPNGRRPGDDTIDVLLFLISNGGLTMGDNVNENEFPLLDTLPFPYLAPTHQPLLPGTIDSRTRH